MKIKLNTDLNGYKSGQEITIKSENGIPLDSYWRARVKDSKLDGCLNVIEKTCQKKHIKKQKK